MYLNFYRASQGDIKYLEDAHRAATTALVQRGTPEVIMKAGAIVVGAGYVHKSMVRKSDMYISF